MFALDIAYAQLRFADGAFEVTIVFAFADTLVGQLYPFFRGIICFAKGAVFCGTHRDVARKRAENDPANQQHLHDHDDVMRKAVKYKDVERPNNHRQYQ